MDPKKAGAVLITAVLATEVIKTHEEGIPHTHVEVEQSIHNSRMAMSVYGIEFNQFNNGKTLLDFRQWNFHTF